MNRKQRREVNKEAKKKYKGLNRKKKTIQKTAIDRFGQDPFEEVYEVKKYWLAVYFKTGLKMFPTHTYRIRSLMIRWNIENLFIAWLGYVFKVNDWTVRGKQKPNGAIGKYVLEFRKNKRPYKRRS